MLQVMLQLGNIWVTVVCMAGNGPENDGLDPGRDFVIKIAGWSRRRAEEDRPAYSILASEK